MELFQRLLALRKAEADAHAAERAALLSQLNDALTALERYESDIKTGVSIEMSRDPTLR